MAGHTADHRVNRLCCRMHELPGGAAMAVRLLPGRTDLKNTALDREPRPPHVACGQVRRSEAASFRLGLEYKPIVASKRT